MPENGGWRSNDVSRDMLHEGEHVPLNGGEMKC